MVLGLVLLWMSSSGWYVFGVGALNVTLGLSGETLERRRNESLRVAICLGFLVVAGLLIQSASERLREDEAGSAIFAAIGAVAAGSVGLGDLANVWAVARLKHGKDVDLTAFFARHWKAG